MKVVIDTNVLVSGLLSPYSAAANIVRMVVAGTLDLLYDARIIAEYEEVLSRPKFSFNKTHVSDLMEFITHFGIPVTAAAISGHMPDPDDRSFLEVAVSGKADCLITGNTTHYPMKFRHKTQVIAPRQFLNRYF